MGNMIEARPARRWSAVAPAITVAILQAVVTVVVYVMWAVDAIHVVGCCGFARSETHRLLGILIIVGAYIVSRIVGYAGT